MESSISLFPGVGGPGARALEMTYMANESSAEEQAEKPTRSAASPSPEDLPGALEDAQREVDALVSRLRYLQAEFDNFRKRAAKEAESIVRYAQEGLLARLLPVLDELDTAVEEASGGSKEGVRMVRDNLLQALRDAGLQEIPAQGLPFDPYVHECLERSVDATVPDGVVTSVVRKGYRLHDRILRPAQVIVATHRGDTDAEDHRN